LQIACRFFPAPRPSLDQTHQLEYPRIVRQGLTSNFQLGQGSVIIEVSSIKIFRACKVRFARVGTEAKRCLNGRLCLSQARRRSIVAEEVKNVVDPSQLTVCLEKRRIPRDSLVQKIDRFQQVLFPGIAKECGRRKTFGAGIKIEGIEVSGRWSLDIALLIRRDFGVKLVGDRLGYFTLNCK